MAASDGDPTYEVPKEEFAALLNEAVTMATARQLQVEQLRGVALYDTQRDERLISLKSFELVVAAALSLSNFTLRFGSSAGRRIVLQFLYEYFRRHGKVEFNEAIFESLWRDLIAEIDEPDWIFRGVSRWQYRPSSAPDCR